MRVATLKMAGLAAAESVVVLPRGLAPESARRPGRRTPGVRRGSDELHGATPRGEPFSKLWPVAFCSDTNLKVWGPIQSYMAFSVILERSIKAKEKGPDPGRTGPQHRLAICYTWRTRPPVMS